MNKIHPIIQHPQLDKFKTLHNFKFCNEKKSACPVSVFLKPAQRYKYSLYWCLSNIRMKRGAQKSLENHRCRPQFETCNVSPGQSSLFCVLGPPTLRPVMSVRLVVFSVFRTKSLDRTAKTKAKFKTFCSRALSGLVVSPTHAVQRCARVGKRPHNTQKHTHSNSVENVNHVNSQVRVK